MIRQARKYLLSAVSGASLIAVAIAVFVVLVSAQVFHDWPIAALGDSGPKPSVSSGKALPGSSAGGETTTADLAKAAAPTATGKAAGAPNAARKAGTGPAVDSNQTTPVNPGAAEPAPSSGGGPTNGGESSPANPSQPPATTAPPGNGGGSGGSGGGGGGGSNEGGSGGSGGSGGGGESGGSAPKAPSASAGVTEAVNGAVNGVDEATGGVVGSTGVTEVTEGVVNGVAGPESTVGKVVDGTVETVNGLLGGGK